MACTVQYARDSANRLVERIVILNARYRRDISDRLIGGDLERPDELGLLDRPMLRQAHAWPL
jgi:hypothetical protein